MIDHSAGDSARAARLAVAGLAEPEREIKTEKRDREGKENEPASGSTRAASIAFAGPVVELAAGYYRRQGWSEEFRTSYHQ